MRTPKEVALSMLQNATLKSLAKSGVNQFFEDNKYQYGLRSLLYSKIPGEPGVASGHYKDFATLVIEEIAIFVKSHLPPEDVRQKLRKSYEHYFIKTLEKTEEKYQPQVPLIIEGNKSVFIEVPHYVIGEETMSQNQVPVKPQDTAATQAPVIERKTFICGELARNMSDDDIFNKIKSLENQVEHWKSIKNKPRALKDKIKKLKAGIRELVDFLDQGRPFN